MIDSRFEYFAVVNIVYLTTLCLLLQDDVNAYRSSPPLLGIFRPSYLVPSAHAEPLPSSEDSSKIEDFSSDDKTIDAEAREKTDDDGRERSASPSEDAQSGHPKGTRSFARKRHSSSQTTNDR